MLLFWFPGTLHGLPLLQKPILGRLFTMQTFVHNGGEKLAEGVCGKQNNVISVPQGIFSGVMPLVNVNCLSWRHAICVSFHPSVATSLHYRGDELIKKELERNPLICHMSDMSLTFSEALQNSLCHDTGKERDYQ